MSVIYIYLKMENIQITNVRSLGPWKWDFTKEGVVDVSGVPQSLIDSIPDIQVSAPNITSPTTLITTITTTTTSPQPGCSHWVPTISSTRSAFDGSPVMYNIADLEPPQGNAASKIIEISDGENDISSKTEMDLYCGERLSPKEPRPLEPEDIWELKEKSDYPRWMGSPVNPAMTEFKPPNGEIIIISDSDNEESDQ